jgi:argininosuccinate lyase
MNNPPAGYLGAEGRVGSGPSDSLVASGYRLEIADVGILHRGLGLADIAHLFELADVGVVPVAACRQLLHEILSILETPADRFPYDPVYGDAYNSRERELERRLGSTAGWLHTGRTRREAGRIAFRLALRRRLLDLHDQVVRFGSELARSARSYSQAVWNDTTYLQPAQPSTFGHYLASFAEQTTRDLERLRAAYRLVNRSPAGAGGTAGTAVPLDRSRLAAALGFDELAWNVRDGMWSVDWLTDVVVGATQAVINADRLAEDLEVFASPQFGYVSLSGASSRASVLLPQKRNPYALAVIRGGAGTLIGRSTGVMATERTPSARTDNWLYAYGEVWGTVDLATRLVALAADVVGSMDVDVAALAASAGAHFSISADLAERLVLDLGLDYRTAYRIVGKAVATAAGAGVAELGPGDLAVAAQSLGVAVHGSMDEALAMVADPNRVALGRDTPGGSAPHRVERHCEMMAESIEVARSWSAAARRAAEDAEGALVARARRQE